jgi:hypothetical protein
MTFDVRTLLVVHCVVSLTLAALMAIFWRVHRGTPGLGHWTLGTALIGFGILAGMLRGLIPDLLSIVAANTAGAVGLAAFWNGIRLFDGRRARWVAPLLVAGAVAAFLAHHTYVVNDILGRIVVVSSVLSAGCLLCARELVRVRGSARTLRIPATLAAVLFGMVALSLAIRGAATVVFPPEPDLFGSSAAQSIHFLLSLMGKILIVVTLLMMAVQRLQWQIEARNADLSFWRR